MTTSPFGTPAPAPVPQPAAVESSGAGGRRKGLLIGVAGAAAVALAAGGVYFFVFAGGEEPAPQADVPRGTATAPEPAETPAEGEAVTTLSSRNPFATLAGAGGAAATSPETVSSTGGSSTGGSSTGSSSGSSASVGADGTNGKNGKNGKDGAPGKQGAPGAAGANGLSPAWVTITLRDVVDDATPDPKGTFTVRDASGEVSTPNVAVADQVAEVGDTVPQAVSVVSFEDLDGDGEMDYAVVQVGEAGAQYSVWIGEALPLFGY